MKKKDLINKVEKEFDVRIDFPNNSPGICVILFTSVSFK